MAHYRNDLTEYAYLWIESNIHSQELAAYEAPEMEYNGKKHTFVLAYYEEENSRFQGRFYSIQTEQKLHDNPGAFTQVAYLDCLNIETTRKRREAILQLITDNYRQAFIH